MMDKITIKWSDLKRFVAEAHNKNKFMNENFVVLEGRSLITNEKIELMAIRCPSCDRAIDFPEKTIFFRDAKRNMNHAKVRGLNV